jgi:hypothetical protein
LLHHEAKETDGQAECGQEQWQKGRVQRGVDGKQHQGGAGAEHDAGVDGDDGVAKLSRAAGPDARLVTAPVLRRHHRRKEATHY